MQKLLFRYKTRVGGVRLANERMSFIKKRIRQLLDVDG